MKDILHYNFVPKMEDFTPNRLRKRTIRQSQPINNWPWSPKEDGSLFTSINNKTGEKLPLGISASKSVISKERNDAFLNVLSEQDYFYRVMWHPIVMLDQNTNEEYIIALKSEPIIFNKGLVSLMNWSMLLNDLLLLKGVKISNCMDVAPPIGSFVITVIDPQILQAVDALLEQAMDIETQEYIDDLTPTFYQQFGEFIDPQDQFPED